MPRSNRDLSQKEIAELVQKLRANRRKQQSSGFEHGLNSNGINIDPGHSGEVGPTGHTSNDYGHHVGTTGTNQGVKKDIANLKIIYLEKQITLEVTPEARRICTWQNGKWGHFDWAIKQGNSWGLVKDNDKRLKLEQTLWVDRNYNIESILGGGQHVFQYKDAYEKHSKENAKLAKKVLSRDAQIENLQFELTEMKRKLDNVEAVYATAKANAQLLEAELNKANAKILRLTEELQDAEYIIMNKKSWWEKIFK